MRDLLKFIFTVAIIAMVFFFTVQVNADADYGLGMGQITMQNDVIDMLSNNGTGYFILSCQKLEPDTIVVDTVYARVIVASQAIHSDSIIADTITANNFILSGLMNVGTSGTKYDVTTGDNIIGIYAEDGTCTGYTDGLSVGLYASGGNGTGALRPVQAFGYNSSGGSLSELYGGSFYAIQEDDSNIEDNLYSVMGYAEIEETDEGDTPDGYLAGLLGIYDTNGVNPTISLTNPGGKAAVIGVIKDNANTVPHAAIMAFAEGDATGTTIPAAFKAVSVRSTAGGGFDYGIDFNDEAGYGENIQTAEIRGMNGETIDNTTDGEWDFGAANLVTTGNITASGGVTFNVTTVEDSAYTVLVSDYIINISHTDTDTVDVTIPTSLISVGKRFEIWDTEFNADTNYITINTEGAETVNEAAADTISTAGGKRIIWSDGTNWFSRE
jgi:hypothetical protein